MDGWRNEARAAHEEGRKISGWCQKERWHRDDKTRRSKTNEQNTAARNERFAVAAPVGAITFIRLEELRCHRKNIPIQNASADPALATKTEDSRKNPRRTESGKSTFDPTTRANGNKPSELATPTLTSKATGQTFDRTRPDRAIAALRKKYDPAHAHLLIRDACAHGLVQLRVGINLVSTRGHRVQNENG